MEPIQLKVWRGVAIAALAACLLLGIGLALATRIEKVKTVTVQITKFIKKNVYVERHETYDPSTGHLTGVTTTTTDRTESGTKETIKEKETEKPVSKTMILTAGYDLRAGTFTAGAGVVILNFIAVQATNPVALKFQPAIFVSVLF